MKIALVWLAVFLSLNCFAEERPSHSVTISVSDVSAEKAFLEVMSQAGCNYVYPAGLLDGLRVTLSAGDMPLRAILDKMFRDTPVDFKIKSGNVILFRKKEKQSFTVSGFVKEGGTGESLPGAVVTDSVSGVTVLCNGSGFYSMRLPPGKARIVAFYPGFLHSTVHRNVLRDSRLDFNLNLSRLDTLMSLDEVVVDADPIRASGLGSAMLGHRNLSRRDIMGAPVLLGEADVVKALQLQPGVSTGMEGMSGMYVHGGAGDENLVMLDNVPIYQVNHFGGLFSAFNADAVKSVDFYKSTFPARYNGRLSSVVDVHTRDGNDEEHHGAVRLGLVSAGIYFEGPIVKKRTSYSVAIRRSWYEMVTVPVLAIANSVRDDKEYITMGGYSFTDMNVKLTHRFNRQSKISAMFYFGNDYLKAGHRRETDIEASGLTLRARDVAKFRWGNLLGSLSWNHMWSPTLFSEATVSYTWYDSDLTRVNYEPMPEELPAKGLDYHLRNAIKDWNIRLDFGWHPGRGHKMNYGFNATRHDFLPWNIKSIWHDGRGVTVVKEYLQKEQATELSAYADYDCAPTDKLRVFAGLNLNHYRIGKSGRLSADPRISARWKLTDDVSVKGSYGRMTQHVHQLIQSSLSLPTDRWIPVGPMFAPGKSDKLSAGVFMSHDGKYIFSAEAYYKRMHGIVDYADDYMVMDPMSDPDAMLSRGEGRSCGIDLTAERRVGRLTGSVGYSLMWADRKFPDRNMGKWYPAEFDNRHKINIRASYRLSSKWEFNLAWIGMSGNRTTVYDQNYEMADNPAFSTSKISDEDLDFAGRLNGYRLPFYHRLDLSATFHRKRGYWNFSLFNAYCNMNVVAIKKEWDLGAGTPSGYVKVRLLPVIPSVSYTWNF